MKSTGIFILVLLNCAPLLLRAGPLPLLPGGPIERPGFAGAGGVQLSRMAVVGNLIYVADGYAGLVIYDVGDPTKPRQVGIYPTEAPAVTVDVAGTNAWLSTLTGRLMFDISEPSNPQLLASTSTAHHRIQTEGSGRLLDVQIEHAIPYTRAESEPKGAIAAVVGDRLYISRDDGVIVLQLHGFRLPPVPSVARRIGADPVSTELWQPSQVDPDNRGIQFRTLSVPMAFSTESLAVVTRDEHVVPTEQPWALTASSSPSVRITGAIDSGVLRLSLSGPEGEVVRVQRSLSVSDGWQDWRTIALSDAPIELTDEQAGDVDQIFYRAVSP